MATIYRCAFQAVLGGAEIINSFHIKKDPDALTTDVSADDVAGFVSTWLATAWKAVVPEEATVQTLTVREELAPGDSSVPDEGSRSYGTAGTLATGDTVLPRPMCMWVAAHTNAAVRSGHGGMFLPPALASNYLDAGGVIKSTNDYWNAAATLIGDLLAGHDYTIVPSSAGHLSYVIYSRTRRARGDAEYYFDVTSMTRHPEWHWLRSRSTAP